MCSLIMNFRRGAGDIKASIYFYMSGVESGPDWHLQKLDTGVSGDIENICTVLLEVWSVVLEKQKGIEGKRGICREVAMDGVFNQVREWKKAKESAKGVQKCTNRTSCSQIAKWQKPDEGSLECNVDASYDKEAQTCTTGMVIRNYMGEFVERKVVSINKPATVFEAECLGVR